MKWISSTIPGKSGKLLFPADFDLKMPEQFATNETLRYYGCSFADSNSVQVSLLYRHGVQDFTYQNQYLEDYVKNTKMLGGSGNDAIISTWEPNVFQNYWKCLFHVKFHCFSSKMVILMVFAQTFFTTGQI